MNVLQAAHIHAQVYTLMHKSIYTLYMYLCGEVLEETDITNVKPSCSWLETADHNKLQETLTPE